ncbi:MAG: hypothetical protein E6767_09850 [Dysgonomonas sp.]|nr:hypothetical protein [Dysgonomonas sp.]
MGKYISVTIFFIIIFSQPCYSQKRSLSGKEFVSEDKIKSESLIFLDDSICVYTQTFHCDINKIFEYTEIRCKYNINKELILLKPIERPSYLEGLDYFLIPDSILKKCDLIYIDTPDDPFILNRIAGWTKENMYGYINNIDEETILYYHNNDNIIYANLFTCMVGEAQSSRFTPFTQKGKKRISNKALNKLMRSGKIPVNNIEKLNSIQVYD